MVNGIKRILGRLFYGAAERRQLGSRLDWIFWALSPVLGRYRKVSRNSRILPTIPWIRKVRINDWPVLLSVRLVFYDRIILDEIFFRQDYAGVAKHGPKDVTTIVDIGANIGLSVNYWRVCYPNARIIAVEPDRENLYLCRCNALKEADGGVVTFHAACIWRKSGMVIFDKSGADSDYHIVQEGHSNLLGETAECLSVPDLFVKAGVEGVVDVLKCDVEGAEKEIFEDCADWICKVRFLAIEIHHPYTVQELMSALGRGGVYPRMVEEHGAVADGNSLLLVEIQRFPPVFS